jgi:hypothetical protein
MQDIFSRSYTKNCIKIRLQIKGNAGHSMIKWHKVNKGNCPNFTAIMIKLHSKTIIDLGNPVEYLP